MSLFTSDREGRLWLWTVVLLVAIYSTMGPAQKVAEFLRERNLLRLSFSVVLFLLVVTVVWRWIRSRPGWREVGVAVVVFLAYLMSLARIFTPEERTHLIEYSAVAVLIHQALVERQRNGRKVPVPAILALALTVLLGWLDEGIQALLPNRVYDIRDVGFNLLAAVMAIGASLAIGRARRWDIFRSRSR